MKTIVINLKKREDRLASFKTCHPDLNFEVFNAVDGGQIHYGGLLSQGFDVCHDWIDPLLNTRLTKGEVGCFLSHWSIWQKCIERNEKVLILEDDARLTDRFDLQEIEEITDTYDFLYLGWKEMDKSIPIDDKLVRPVYPYWTLGYVITPSTAKILCSDAIKQNIIPVDEYLPTMMSKLNAVAYKENVVTPVSREILGSDVLSRSRYDLFVDGNIYLCTVATDEKKAHKLKQSAKKNGGHLINLGEGVVWEGGDMKGQGGGHKINLVKEYIKDKRDTDIFIFLDGYDTFLSDTITEIISRFLEIHTDILFSSERICWPDERIGTLLKELNTNQDTPYQYLNSGCYIGRVGRLKELFAEPLENYDDDQLYVQKQYLKNPKGIDMDVEGYIWMTHDTSIIPKNGQLYNPITRCYGCAYHGNGGRKEKEFCELLYLDFYGVSSITYIPTKNYEVVSQDIILIDFMSKDMCEKMISLAEDKQFHIMEGDKVPSQDLRLRELGLWKSLEEHWMKTVYDIVYQYWYPCHMYGLRDAFIIKYEMDKQRSLRLHNDASLVTGSVKLNDDYEGGLLEFPRYNFTNADVPVGKCLLFPGQVTHGHTSTELQKGTKYSLTIWSSRYKNDRN
jgi:GR25 family glycosyltransferase involved in LPS biosynthesis